MDETNRAPDKTPGWAEIEALRAKVRRLRLQRDAAMQAVHGQVRPAVDVHRLEPDVINVLTVGWPDAQPEHMGPLIRHLAEWLSRDFPGLPFMVMPAGCRLEQLDDAALLGLGLARVDRPAEVKANE